MRSIYKGDIVKILQVIRPVGMGGVERISIALDEYFQSLGAKSYIAINQSMYSNYIDHFEIKNCKNLVTYNDNTFFEEIHDIKKIIRNIKPDIIQTHARNECVLVAISNKECVHVRTQHMIETNKIPVSVFEKTLLKKRVNMWVSTSEMLAKNYLIREKQIDKSKINVIYNGVPKPLYLKAETRIINNHFCVVSRLTFQKGIDILLRSLHSMPKNLLDSIIIDIYGEGEEKENLLHEAKELQLLNTVHFKNAVKNSSQVLINYDVLLMPSRYEGLPLTLLEAMSVGTPVAIHDVGCVREFIKSGENGWIIDNNYKWKDLFEDLISKKYNFNNISSNAKNTYQLKFQEEGMCKKYYDLYKELTEK